MNVISKIRITYFKNKDYFSMKDTRDKMNRQMTQ